GIGRELRSPPGAVGVDRLDQPDGTHGNEVVRFCRPAVLLDDMGDEAHIMTHERIFSRLVAFACAAEILRLLLRRKRLGKGTLPAYRRSEEQQFAEKYVQKFEK